MGDDVLSLPNNAFDRTAGSHTLAAAGQRERWAECYGVRVTEWTEDEPFSR